LAAALMAVCVLLGSARGAARQKDVQETWLQDALDQYAAGDFAKAAIPLRGLGDLRVLQADLLKVSIPWLAGKSVAPDLARRSLAGFALEAAAYHVGNQTGAAMKLMEWACLVVRKHVPADDFDRRWHVAAIAAVEGALDPVVLETQIDHAMIHLGNDPRLSLARGIAAEQRLKTAGRADQPLTEVETTRYLEAAIRAYTEAQAVDAVAAEASVRLGYAQYRRHRDDLAIAALERGEQISTKTRDTDVIYWSRLFLGLAYEAATRPKDADAAYRRALDAVPHAHAAEIALVALLFRNEQRSEASALADDLVGQTTPADDPWWYYWPADYRLIDPLLVSMRGAVR
jgi:tetratricopeptide (TPR) repeat protein